MIISTINQAKCLTVTSGAYLTTKPAFIMLGIKHTLNPHLVENVEHYGGQPEQAATATMATCT